MNFLNPCSRPKADRANFEILSFFSLKCKILLKKILKFLLNYPFLMVSFAFFVHHILPSS